MFASALNHLCSSLLAFCLLLAPFFVFADDAPSVSKPSSADQSLPAAQDLPSQDDLDRVAQMFVWRKLIQSGSDGQGGNLATVLSDNFYLSGSEILDASAELEETLIAFAENHIIAKEPASCRFPARLLWLELQFPSFAKSWERPDCPQLDAWANLDDLQGISLLQVSGYFGNPASAFGHLLLQVNREGSEGFRGLQDTGVNFGAKVPKNEPMLAYVLRGLLGSYNASFSDKSFYAQDHVYSATEFRDMWSYELNLDDYQKKIILYHIWELKDALFKYYFLKINCAFHLAQLMEIAFETDFGLDSQPWYLPVSVFHTLSDEDAKQPGRLIKSIDFIPSLQREVHVAFDKLSDDDKGYANRFIVSDDAAKLPNSPSTELLEFLLLHIDYQSQNAAKAQRVSLRERRTPLLLARLRLPERKSNVEHVYDIENYAPPASGPKTRKVAFGPYSEEGESFGTAVVLAPFAFDILNNNTGDLVDSNFKAAELTLVNQDGDTRLERLDLISIEKLAPPLTSLAGEQKWTWRMAIGARDFPRRCDDCLTFMVEGGVGRSKQVGEKLNVYGFFTGELNRLGVDAGLAAGFLWQMLPRLRWRLESHAQVLSTVDGLVQDTGITHTLTGLWNLGQSWDISGIAEISEENNEGAVVVNYRF